MTDHEQPLWQRDETRFVDKRAEYLKRVLDIDERKARAVGYSDLGYSDAGIAQEMAVTEGTASSWLDDVARKHGSELVLAKAADEIAVDAGPSPQEVRDE